MIQPPKPHRRALLLLAAAALPLAPIAAQEAQQPADPPADEAPAQPAPKAKASPVTIEAPPPPKAEAPPEPAQKATPAPEPEAGIPPGFERTPAPPVAPGDPAPAEGTVADPLPADALPVEVLPEPEAVPEAEDYPVEVLPERQMEDGGSALPLILVGLLAVAALAFLLLRGRGRRRVFVADEVEADYEPVAAPAARATRPEPKVLTPEPPPPPEVIPLGIAAEDARPWLDLELHPLRAGVVDGEVRVEFQLAVRNQGSAPARSVRISTFMRPAGARSAHPEGDELPETTIEAGSGKRIESSVELPTALVGTDSLLPIVVAEARYRLPDGSEGRTAASFAVGLPDGGELARFAVDEPSGLHEGVEALPLGEPERS